MIIKTSKIRDSHINIPFNFLWITINMYMSTTKVKAYKKIQCMKI